MIKAAVLFSALLLLAGVMYAMPQQSADLYILELAKEVAELHSQLSAQIQKNATLQAEVERLTKENSELKAKK